MDNKILEEQILYGYISTKDEKMTNYWFFSFEEAKKRAEFDQPYNKSYLIIKRTEHYEVVGEVK